MEQRIGQRVRISEIAPPAQHAGQRMVRGQGFQQRSKVPQIRVRGAHPEQATILLHHVEAGSPVGSVDHQVQRAFGPKHVAQGAQTAVRVGQMVQHPGADDLVEGLPELLHTLDRQLVQIEVREPVLALQLTRAAQADGADVDARNVRLGLDERVARRLRGAAARDQDLPVSPRRLRWASGDETAPGWRAGLRYRSRCSSRLVSGGGYGLPFVEIVHRVRRLGRRRSGRVAPVHRDVSGAGKRNHVGPPAALSASRRTDTPLP